MSLISNLSNFPKRNRKSLLRSPSPSEASSSKERDGIQRKNFWPNLIRKFTTIRYRRSVFALAKSRRMNRRRERRMSTDVRCTELRLEPECFCRPVTRPISSLASTFPPIVLKSIGSTEVWQGLLKSQIKIKCLFWSFLFVTFLRNK